MNSNLNKPISVIIADDHELFRDGFVGLLNKSKEITVTGEAADGMQLLQLARRLKPDIIVTDIQMPGMNGIDATKKLSQELPNIGIIALSMFAEQSLVIDMLEAGAKGYLLKNASKADILNAIKSVHKDQPYYCKNIDSVIRQIKADNNAPVFLKKKPLFTKKELSIIKLICKQYNSCEIGNELNVSWRTIEGHRLRILEKIDAKNTVGIVLYAVRNNISF